MSGILNYIRDEVKLRATLFWFWIIAPVAYFLFIYISTVQTGIDFRSALSHPNIALSFLISCMSIIMAFVYRLTYEENRNTERVFCWYAVIQQLLVGNPIGFLLAAFQAVALRDVQREPLAPSRMRWVILGGIVLISFLTLLTIIARINQFMSA